MGHPLNSNVSHHVPSYLMAIFLDIPHFQTRGGFLKYGYTPMVFPLTKDNNLDFGVPSSQGSRLPCSKTCCTTKFPKVWRQSCGAPARTWDRPKLRVLLSHDGHLIFGYFWGNVRRKLGWYSESYLVSIHCGENWGTAIDKNAWNEGMDQYLWENWLMGNGWTSMNTKYFGVNSRDQGSTLKWGSTYSLLADIPRCNMTFTARRDFSWSQQ